MYARVVLASVLAVVVLALLVTGPAFAGPPGKWTRVTGADGVEALNTDEVGLERTADGVLHVAWTRRAAGLADALMQSAIAANTKSVSGPVTIVGPPNNGLNGSVDLVSAPGGGLRVLFSGLFPMSGIDVVMSTSTASATGTGWTPPLAVSSTGTPSPVYIAAGIGGAVSPAGTVVSTWGDSGPGDGGFHVGLSPADPDNPFGVAASNVNPNVAFDSASGSGYIAWNVLGGIEPGSLRVMALQGGSVLAAPNSAARWIGQRVSISGRIGAGGVYVAYGSGGNEFSARPAWWRVGTKQPRIFKRQRDAEHTGLAPAPAGRLWLYWERDGRLYAVRTDRKAKKPGAIVSLKAPKGTRSIYRLNGEGSRGPLDLLALADAKGGLGYFHQRILPGLSLSVQPKPVERGKQASFRVSDAGTPVKGAWVTFKLGKKKLSKKTNAKGKATIKVPAGTRPGRYSAAVHRGGYTRAKRKVRVKG